MNLKSRIERIEKHIGEICPLCGADREAVAARDRFIRERAEEAFSELAGGCVDWAQSVEELRIHAPVFARALGFTSTLPPGFCQVCGADQRTPGQREADLQRSSKELLEKYTVALDGDGKAAIERLREVAPTVARYAAADI